MEGSMQQVIAHIEAHLDELVDQVAAAVVAADLGVYRNLPPAQIRAIAARAFVPFVDDLRAGSLTAYPTFWREVGPQRAQAGVAIGDLLGLIDNAMAIMSASVSTTFAADPEATSWWFARMHSLSYAAATALAETFVMAREQLIQAQTHELLVLSTPLIPIADGILVFPLLGRIDPQRAQHMLEVVLAGIARLQAAIVLVDVTAVPGIDTAGAHALLQIARAARLLGAQLMLVGIGPEIAQSIVQLGLELAGLDTYANLQSGITAALAQQGLAIVARTTRQQENVG
jgi:rsbT co-antagonist protein RsbR